MERCLNCMKEYQEGDRVCPHCGYVKGTAPKEIYHLTPGTILSGRYVIGTVVGSGGFGVVYRAWDKNLDKLVAIKEYYPMSLLTRIPGTNRVEIHAKKHTKEYYMGRERFLEEARNMARFSNHPNIVNVYNFFEENNTAYFVMEYMDGISYKEYIKRQGGIVSEETAVKITLVVLDALADIHKSGIIHRDIAPDNVMILKNGVVKLMDFGAARFSKSELDDKKLTVIIKPGFAPPEQHNSNAAQGPYTDIYAVGAMLYRAVTGVMPEKSTDRREEECLMAPRELNPQLSENLNNVILRSMAVQPQLRFQSTAEMKEALLTDKRVLDAEQELKRRRKKRVRSILAAAVLLLIGGVIGIFSYNGRRAETELKAASLVMWAAAEEGQEAAVTEMYAAVLEDFMNVYPDVTVTVEAVPSGEYEERLAEAAETGAMPDIYESSFVAAGELSDALNLDKLFQRGWIDTGEYYLLEEYRNGIEDMRQLPVSFNLPVLYVRVIEGTAAEVDEEDLLDAPGFTEETLNAFLVGETDFLLADTSCYDTVNGQLPGRYELQQIPERVNTGITPAVCFSISGGLSMAEKNAAFQLLRYLLSDNAQTMLCIQYHDGVEAYYGVPVRKEQYQLYIETKISGTGAKVLKESEVPGLSGLTE